MSDPMSPSPVPAKPRRGCFFYGCITGLILLVIVVVAGVAGYYALKKKLTSWVDNYTDTQPMTLPTVSLSRDDLDKLNARFGTFKDSVRSNQPTAPLVLTSDDLNGMLAESPDAKQSKGKLYVTLDGSKVKGDISLPLDDLGTTMTMFKGRYLNGSGTFNVSLHDGVLFVAPDMITVKGKPLPDAFMQGLRNANLAQGVTNNPDAMVILNKLKEIEIKDSKLIVVPKVTSGAAEAAP